MIEIFSTHYNLILVFSSLTEVGPNASTQKDVTIMLRQFYSTLNSLRLEEGGIQDTPRGELIMSQKCI